MYSSSPSGVEYEMTLGEGNLSRLLLVLLVDEGLCNALEFYPFYRSLVRADDEEVGVILQGLPILLPCFLWPRVRRVRLHSFHHKVSRPVCPECLWKLHGVQVNTAVRTLAQERKSSSFISLF